MHRHSLSITSALTPVDCCLPCRGTSDIVRRQCLPFRWHVRVLGAQRARGRRPQLLPPQCCRRQRRLRLQARLHVVRGHADLWWCVRCGAPLGGAPLGRRVLWRRAQVRVHQGLPGRRGPLRPLPRLQPLSQQPGGGGPSLAALQVGHDQGGLLVCLQGRGSHVLRPDQARVRRRARQDGGAVRAHQPRHLPALRSRTWLWRQRVLRPRSQAAVPLLRECGAVPVRAWEQGRLRLAAAPSASSLKGRVGSPVPGP